MLIKKYYGVIGAGGHGREVMPMLHASLGADSSKGKIEIVFVVEGQNGEAQINGYRSISLEAFHALEGIKRFNIAIGDSRVRERMANLCLAEGMEPFSLIAPSAIILDNNEIGDGCMISEQTIITSNVKIGRFFQANCQCNISHDCVIGSFVTFAPGAKCNGNVIIKDHAYIGAGALLKQGRYDKPLVIGEGAIVGMGAVVIRDVAPFTVVAGNPAKVIFQK